MKPNLLLLNVAKKVTSGHFACLVKQNLQKLVSKILSIPVSNAPVERIFSLCGAQWTDPRNSLKVETVKSLAQIKMNYDLNCSQMYNLLISSPELLKKVMSVEKYDFKK